MEIILASASPRRKELMGHFPFPVTVRVSQADEKMDSGKLPQDEVARISRNKARAVDRLEDDIVIGADTIVVCDGVILGKPKDEADALRMLSLLSGRAHQVMTGVWIIETDEVGNAVKEDGFTDVTTVDFWAFSEDEAREYVATKEPMDKAGAYGIQGKGMRLVKGINGDFFTVMGLPGGRLIRFLHDFVITP